METIASFQVDHTRLLPGMYISRVDGDVVTYDIRFIRPNTPPYLEIPAIHTIEHLGATYLRNSAHRDGVIYFGPMGCRTGFYFLSRGISHSDAVSLLRETMRFIAAYTGEIPGTTARECGNYLEHDLEGARLAAARMAEVLADWTADRLSYT